MNIKFSTYNNYNNYSVYPSDYKSKTNLPEQNPTFTSAKSRKFLIRVAETENMKLIKATFEDMVGAYNELGFDVVMKRGSHAHIQISKNIHFNLVIPHKRKHVSPLDLKRLKLVMKGDLEKAQRINFD